jgi:hypothetical protein
MQALPTIKRPVSLTVLCLVYLIVLALTVLLYINLYTAGPYEHAFALKWTIIMISLNIPMLLGVIFMYRLRRIGLWMFITGKILFFAIPQLAGTTDSVMGLATPLFFLESSVFIILFGNRVKYMR